MESITDVESEETSERVCCPDDLCTGALDHEGRCGECGRVFAQYAREPAQRSEEPRSEEPRVESDGESDGEGEAPAYPAAYREAPPTEEVEPERECCDDDLCTGALGPDGVCGTCGRSSIKLKESSVASEGERGE